MLLVFKTLGLFILTLNLYGTLGMQEATQEIFTTDNPIILINAKSFNGNIDISSLEVLQKPTSNVSEIINTMPKSVSSENQVNRMNNLVRKDYILNTKEVDEADGVDDVKSKQSVQFALQTTTPADFGLSGENPDGIQLDDFVKNAKYAASGKADNFETEQQDKDVMDENIFGPEDSVDASPRKHKLLPSKNMLKETDNFDPASNEKERDLPDLSSIFQLDPAIENNMDDLDKPMNDEAIIEDLSVIFKEQNNSKDKENIEESLDTNLVRPDIAINKDSNVEPNINEITTATVISIIEDGTTVMYSSIDEKYNKPSRNLNSTKFVTPKPLVTTTQSESHFSTKIVNDEFSTVTSQNLEKDISNNLEQATSTILPIVAVSISDHIGHETTDRKLQTKTLHAVDDFEYYSTDYTPARNPTSDFDLHDNETIKELAKDIIDNVAVTDSIISNINNETEDFTVTSFYDQSQISTTNHSETIFTKTLNAKAFQFESTTDKMVLESVLQDESEILSTVAFEEVNEILSSAFPKQAEDDVDEMKSTLSSSTTSLENDETLTGTTSNLINETEDFIVSSHYDQSQISTTNPSDTIFKSLNIEVLPFETTTQKMDFESVLQDEIFSTAALGKASDIQTTACPKEIEKNVNEVYDQSMKSTLYSTTSLQLDETATETTNFEDFSQSNENADTTKATILSVTKYVKVSDITRFKFLSESEQAGLTESSTSIIDFPGTSLPDNEPSDELSLMEQNGSTTDRIPTNYIGEDYYSMFKDLLSSVTNMWLEPERHNKTLNRMENISSSIDFTTLKITNAPLQEDKLYSGTTSEPNKQSADQKGFHHVNNDGLSMQVTYETTEFPSTINFKLDDIVTTKSPDLKENIYSTGLNSKYVVDKETHIMKIPRKIGSKSAKIHKPTKEALSWPKNAPSKSLENDDKNEGFEEVPSIRMDKSIQNLDNQIQFIVAKVLNRQTSFGVAILTKDNLLSYVPANAHVLESDNFINITWKTSAALNNSLMFYLTEKEHFYAINKVQYNQVTQRNRLITAVNEHKNILLLPRAHRTNKHCRIKLEDGTFIFISNLDFLRKLENTQENQIDIREEALKARRIWHVVLAFICIGIVVMMSVIVYIIVKKIKGRVIFKVHDIVPEASHC